MYCLFFFHYRLKKVNGVRIYMNYALFCFYLESSGDTIEANSYAEIKLLDFVIFFVYIINIHTRNIYSMIYITTYSFL